LGQTTLRQPTDDAGQIYDAALKLFEKLWRPGQAVRLLGVGVTNLAERPYQPQLWDMETEEFRRAEAAYGKERKLRAVLEALEARYGEEVLRRGVRG
jgi:DNA polymerase-4